MGPTPTLQYPITKPSVQRPQAAAIGASDRASGERNQEGSGFRAQASKPNGPRVWGPPFGVSETNSLEKGAIRGV